MRIRLFDANLWGAVLVGCIVASLAGVYLWGDGHEPPVYDPSGIGVLVVCPSALEGLAAVADAQGTAEALGYPVVPVREGRCEDGPAEGEVQVRRCGDMAPGEWGQDCPDRHYDWVGLRDGRGVVYWRPGDALRCTPLHVVLHAHGVGHTSAATSVMAGGIAGLPCGSDLVLVDRSGE